MNTLQCLIRSLMIRGLHGLCVTIAHCKGNVDANFLSLNDAIINNKMCFTQKWKARRNGRFGCVFSFWWLVLHHWKQHCRCWWTSVRFLKRQKSLVSIFHSLYSSFLVDIVICVFSSARYKIFKWYWTLNVELLMADWEIGFNIRRSNYLCSTFCVRHVKVLLTKDLCSCWSRRCDERNTIHIQN